jgi:proteasome lid subunit RPN8/RPN11
VEGFRAVVARDRPPPATFDIPLTYVASLARAASSRLIEQGKLEAGDRFQYVVCAYACEGRHAASGNEEPSRVAVRAVGQVLNASDRDMAALLAGSWPCGPVEEDQMPVFVPQRIIEEAVELMAAAGDKETGGILIGHLRRDPVRRELFLEVTAQVQAQHAEHEPTRLTFTPETWTAADAALALRARGEIYAGWWHTHPAKHWCDDCPPEKRQRCKVSGLPPGDFFSAHDVALHRAVFPRAYSVALVISDGCEDAGRPTWRLFGWRYGMLMARGFHVLRTPQTSEVFETSEVLG